MEDKKYDVFCIGNALIETTIKVDFEFLKVNELTKGRMYLIKQEKHDILLKSYLPKFESFVPAGAECNVATTIQQIGGKSFFHGKIGNDFNGGKFLEMLTELEVQNRIVIGNTPSGIIFSFITPDNERTMLTYLGASLTFSFNELDLSQLANSKMLYITAFFWEPKDLRKSAIHTLNVAKANKIPIAFDVSDAMIVMNNKDLINEILIEFCHIIFMNEDESNAFGSDLLSNLINLGKILVLKKGSKGAIICENSEEINIPPKRVNIVDTTGAGDSFAAGFILSKLSGTDNLNAGTFASTIASKIICQYGSCIKNSFKCLLT